jgi:hypothetical protein
MGVLFRIMLAGGFHWTEAEGDFQSLISSPCRFQDQLIVPVIALNQYCREIIPVQVRISNTYRRF